MAENPYTDLDLDRDRDSIADTQVAYHQGQVPGWQAKAGDPAVLLIEATSEQHAETRELAVDVAQGVAAEFFESILGIARNDATQASGDTTWVLTDSLGHTIPAGTSVSIGGLEFQTTADVTVTAGSSTTAVGGVPVLAVETGEAANNLSGSVDLIETGLDFEVTSIDVAGVTAGGSDGETRLEFLNRAVRKARTLAPRAIVPNDFEIFAMDVEGVERALAIDLLAPGTDEVQTVTITGAPGGGSFTLTYSGQTTAATVYNASAALVQTRLEALSNIGAGQVNATGGPLPGTAVSVEFTGSLAETNVAQMTATSSLTGGTSPAVTVATATAGVAAVTNQERTVTVAIHDELGMPVPSGVRTEVDTYLQAQREVNFVVYVIDPTYTTIAVTCTVRALPGWDTATVQAQVEDAITAFLDPALWGQPTVGEDRDWVNTTKVRVYDLSTAIRNADGVHYIESLTFGRPGALGSVDVTMYGHAPLPMVGTVSVTANPAA